MCEQSMEEKGQDPLDRHRAAEKICHVQHLSSAVGVTGSFCTVGVHVCLNAALGGLLGVLFWQTPSSADGQASSSWNLLLPCQLFTADDSQDFHLVGFPAFPYLEADEKKKLKKKN